MTVKKAARPINLPGVHPGLLEKIREAEEAELQGRAPRAPDRAQKVVRPTLDASTPMRRAQVRTIGLVDGAHLDGVDPRESLAEQAGYLPGVDLDDVWDELSENQKIRAGSVERFRLEIETAIKRAAMPHELPHQIGGRLDARNLDRITANLRAEAAAFAYLLAADSRALLDRFMVDSTELVRTAQRVKAVIGVEAPATYDILRDWLHKLVYQELVSRRRAMGDRGIRRICTNVEIADQVYSGLKAKPNYSPRQRLLARLVHVHQDIGHTAYAARVSYRASKLHRAYGARIFTDEINRYRALFTHEELELARFAVATHSSEEFPFADTRVLALVRAIDHLAPLSPHRVDLNFKRIDGVEVFLDRLLACLATEDWNGFAGTREALGDHLAGQDVEEPLREDLLAAFRPFQRLADPVDLGQLAGQVSGVQYDVAENPGSLVATYAFDAWSAKYQVLFDGQQDQLVALGKATDVKPEVLRRAAELRFAVGAMGALVIRRAA